MRSGYILISQMFDQKQELLPLREPLCSSRISDGGHGAHLFSFLCCVVLSSACILCVSMLMVSLNWPFLITLWSCLTFYISNTTWPLEHYHLLASTNHKSWFKALIPIFFSPYIFKMSCKTGFLLFIITELWKEFTKIVVTLVN